MKGSGSKSAKRIGIFGGTFNPIHNGHIIIAEFIRAEKKLDEVIFVPCYIPPHKTSEDLAPGEERLRMVELAVDSRAGFRASDAELKRRGKSYSIQTVEELRRLFAPGTRFFFIIGADGLYEIATWKDIDRLTELCGFLIAARRGYPLEGLSPERLSVSEDVFRRLIAGVVETPVVDISSTDIRERVNAGRRLGYLVPEAVEKYITRRGLYK